ncbi:MAG: MBL fold metallo-hydrolase [Alistipes sp.]|nr:MBL fold metallo-hydrolase [Alistipes sp.]
MALFSLFGGSSKGATYPTDTFTAKDGSEIRITFFRHASLAIEAKGKHIYADPVSEFAEYARLPKADLVLVTHSHDDHLDRAAIDDLTTRASQIVCDKTSAEAFDFECTTMTPGMTTDPCAWLHIEARPAYNTSEGRTKFHPREREDCGYLLTLCGGTRIYIPGDTEDNDELLALRDIDILMLPVNQPYTMTVEQAVRVVKAVRPKVFYPIHYGQTDTTTDIDRLAAELEGVTEVRIRPMD